MQTNVWMSDVMQHLVSGCESTIVVNAAVWSVHITAMDFHLVLGMLNHKEFVTVAIQRQ